MVAQEQYSQQHSSTFDSVKRIDGVVIIGDTDKDSTMYLALLARTIRSFLFVALLLVSPPGLRRAVHAGQMPVSCSFLECLNPSVGTNCENTKYVQYITE